MSEIEPHLVSVVYTSRATAAFSDDQLDDLLTHSRRNNTRHGLTGMLLYRDDSFLQVLEGPRREVWDRMSLIELDPRHRDLTMLIAEPIEHRQFAEWSMAYPSAAGIGASSAPGYRTAFDDLYRSVDPGHTETALRELTAWFRDRLDDAGVHHA